MQATDTLDGRETTAHSSHTFDLDTLNTTHNSDTSYYCTVSTHIHSHTDTHAHTCTSSHQREYSPALRSLAVAGVVSI